MILGMVIGTVVPARREPALYSYRLLAVQPIGDDGEPDGQAFVAIDHTEAGEGDRVLVAQGKDAGWPIGRTTAVDMGIMAIVDDMDVTT